MSNYEIEARAALNACPNLLFAWLPGGKLHGVEYDVLNPLRDDRTTGNFRINIQTGRWADFAAPEFRGNDLVSLRATLDGSSLYEAALVIRQQLGIDGPVDPAIAPFLAKIHKTSHAKNDPCILPVPADAPPAPLPSGCLAWSYHDAHGNLLGYVVRFDRTKGDKDFRPLTYGQSGWRFKAWPRPAPLYNQDVLAARPQDPVLVVEGEKTAEAAAQWFPAFVVTTWPGGSSNAPYADWRRLAGRSVWLLPDADEPGKKAMAAIAEALRGVALEIHLADLPPDLPQGWDVADANFASPDAAKAWLDSLTWQCLQPPPRLPETRFDPHFEAVLARANGKGKKHEAKTQDEIPLLPWPHPLPARLEAEIIRRVPFRSSLAARITTKAILAHLAGRQVQSQAGDPTQQYLALVAPSISEVRGYLHAAAALLEQMGLGKTTRQARLSSPAQLFKSLWRSPDLLYLSAEWGITLQFAKRQPAGSLEQALTVISEIWDGHPLVIDPDEVKIKDFSDGQGQAKICAPHLTMLAALSHDQLATAVKLSEAGRGALDQIQYWILDEDDLTPADPDTLTRAPYPDDLITDLQALLPAQTGNLVGHTGPQPIDPLIAHFAEPVAPLFAPLDALPVQRQGRTLVLSARFIACREATTLAFLQDPKAPLLTPDLVRFGVADEVARLRRLLDRFNNLSSDDGKLSAYQRVLDFITTEKTKGARPSDLISGCRVYRSLKDSDRETLLQQLLSDGAIVETYPQSKPGARRKSLVYIAKPYAQEVKS